MHTQSLTHRRKPKSSSAYDMEERSLIDEGETILNKKAVYEPSGGQRCRQLVCSRSWAVAILTIMGMFLVVIAIIASFARPQTAPCPKCHEELGLTTTPAPTPEPYIATNGENFPWKDIRLPDSILPESYHILMHPNISESKFKGKVTITTKCVKPTDFIVFHIKDLNITHFSVVSQKDNEAIYTTKSLEYKRSEQFYVHLSRFLLQDEVIMINIEFDAKLISKLAGFYKSMYKTSSGEKREIATTHFEPTDARAAFPCFDEPQLKANFTMSIVRDKNHISLFNMPLKKTDVYHRENNLLVDHYETSVKMSTYLVAFVVCDFANKSKTTQDGVKVGVFAPSEQIDQAEFALEAAVKVLEYYNDFFGVKYPLPKQDLIAIPDFGAGAMENWGLITYRMNAILYNPEVSSLGNKQWVATVIAHELAHQWFGNLVTMEWWDDLWLNEGFATFVEYLGVDVIDPTFKMKEQFVLEETHRAMYLDSLSNSHAIHVEVKDPKQISEIFDAISYSKGGSLLWMLRDIIKKNNFKRGLMNYLTLHKYENARTDDLWASLNVQDANPKIVVNIKDVMDTWTKQMGYPVVTVKTSGASLSLTQKRFLLNPANANDPVEHSPYNYRWQIPVTFMTSEDTATHHLVWMNSSSVETTMPGAVQWVKANAGMNGYYRVNYEISNWLSIISQLNNNHLVFSPGDRAGLIDDVFALARAGLVNQTVALDLSSYLIYEQDYLPWKTAFKNLAYIEDRLFGKEIYDAYKRFILNLLKERLTTLGWEDKGEYLERVLRAVILTWAIKMEHKPSIDKGRELFKKWTNNNTSLSPNLKVVVYTTGVRYGDLEEWEACWDVYDKSNVPSEQKKMLVAMAQSQNSLILQKYLQLSLDKTKVRGQDTDSVITSIAANPSGEILAWRFVQRNWDTISDRFGGSTFSMSRLIKGIASHFSTKFDYDDVQTFFAKRDVGAGKRAVKQSLEKIDMNINWLTTHEQEVTDWLKVHAPS